ncbi:HlyD family secretion protein [Xenorhabdus innexi]|uniref:Microcin H47 secretion protein mchE n=1 Tax=Xenorhabdus innexi TaxID=290109 RepID=A0A1N6MX11_9GAMM|nr:HlyD family secretion protein [Xenorhabdus innexi]PHM33537.1 RTX toxin transporter RtxD [Xenorhabdus innexi]SIP73371.1 Microcin H47 secretion protein mchE [Xenorhabdus innexi]
MTAMNKLFRQEALDNKKSSWTGEALLIAKVPAWVICITSIVFLSILFLFITFGNYTRRISVYGEVITNPHPINIFSAQQGFILKSFVKVGDIVKKGQKIYQVDISQVTESGKTSTNAQNSLRNQLTQINSIIENLEHNKSVTLASLEEQKKQYELSHEKDRIIVENARQGVEFAKDNMKNYKTYQQRGLITKDQFNNYGYSYYQQQNIYQNLYSQYISDSLKITSLNSDIQLQKADFDKQISQYRIQRDDLKQKLTEMGVSGSVFITSPIDGRIESLSFTVGQMVVTNDNLVQVSPDDVKPTYHLILWVPNSSLPYIKKGDGINIRYDAFPFEKFGQFSGDINNISYIPASQQEMSHYRSSPENKPGEKAESYYKVLISLKKEQFSYNGRKLYLSNGMKAQSTFFLEKRPLYQWMFSPFYDMKKTLTGPKNE